MSNVGFLVKIGKMKRTLLFFTILIGVILFTYWHLSKVFFQQDEWYFFAYTILWQSRGSLAFFRNIFLPGGFAHLTPFSHIFNLVLFNLFFPQTSPFAVISLILHLTNAFLVFYFVKKLTGDRFAGFVASLVFAVCATAQQSVSWFSAFTGAETSTFFLLLTLIFFWKFIQKHNWRFYWLSLGTLIVSLLFKETTIFLFAFLPVWYFFVEVRPRTRSNLIKILSPIGILGIAFLLPRLFTSSPDAAVAGVGAGGAKIILYNLLTIPIKTMYQVFVPPQITYTLSEKLLPHFYPFIAQNYKNLPPYDFVVKDVLGDQISLFFGLILFVGILVFSRVILTLSLPKGKDPAEIQCNIRVLLRQLADQNDLLFGFLFILFSTLPFVILGKQGAYLPSRHYYIPTIGGGILVSVFLSFFLKQLNKLNGISEIRQDLCNVVRFFVLFLLSLYILGNTLLIRADVLEQVKLGHLRRGIINQIMNEHPILPDRVIFFIDGNAKGFYGVPNLKVPFQSGFGNVLLVNYSERGQIPPEFFANEFLWEILKQDYKEAVSYQLSAVSCLKGFGYFWEEKKLRETMDAYGLSKDNVISYFYDAENEELKKMSNF